MNDRSPGAPAEDAARDAARVRRKAHKRLRIERKAHKRLRIEGIVANRPRLGPQTVHLDIASACNTRCTTCWHHSPLLEPAYRPDGRWKRQRLPLDTFLGILDDLLALGGLDEVVLSGMGEPFLHPDIYTMIRAAHARGVGVTCITNLLAVDVPRLLEAATFVTRGDGGRARLNLITSINGVSEDVWTAFHAHPPPKPGQPSGFETVCAKLESLRDAGFRPKHTHVINRQNVHELVDMVRFARRFPVKRVNFKLASLQHGTQAVALTAAQREELLDDLIPRAEGLAHAWHIDNDLPAFRAQVLAHRGACEVDDVDGEDTAPGAGAGTARPRTTDLRAVGCFMGLLYARVTVEGALLYCCNTDLGVGHLGTGGFAEAWTGPRWQSVRDALRAGRYFPGCAQCGKFKQNLKWSQRLRAQLAPEVFQRLLGGPS